MSNLPSFTMRELLEAGVHFGHKTMRWNPKMEPYIYGEHNGVHVIDLQQTVPMLHQALEVVKDVMKNNGRLLFVGTKRQASDIIAEAAKKCGQHYVNYRWLGGMLTNWNTVSQSLRRLSDLEEILEKVEKDDFEITYTKKEILEMTRRRDKINMSLGGIRNMGGKPDLLFVIDSNKDHIAIEEAKKLGITVISVADSNSDPDVSDYIIPGNDDAAKAISLYCNLIADAALAGIQESLAASGVDLGAKEDISIEELEAAKEQVKAASAPKKAAKAPKAPKVAAPGKKVVAKPEEEESTKNPPKKASEKVEVVTKKSTKKAAKAEETEENKGE